MSKLGCICGHTISDSTDCLPYKVRFYSDVDDVDLYEKIMEGFRTFLQAVLENRRKEWLLEQGFTVTSRKTDKYTVFLMSRD